MSQKNNFYEMSTNDCYSTIDSVTRKALAAKPARVHHNSTKMMVPVPAKNKMKCFMVAIVMAIILNFLLVTGFCATLFYFRINLITEVDELSHDQESGEQSEMIGSFLAICVS